MLNYNIKLGQINANVSKTNDSEYTVTFEKNKDLSVYGHNDEWRLHRKESQGQFYNIHVVGDGENKKFGYSNEDKEAEMSNMYELSECHKFIINDVKMIEQIREMINEIEMSPEMRENKLKDRMSALIVKMDKIKENRAQINEQEEEIILEKKNIERELELLRLNDKKSMSSESVQEAPTQKEER